MNNTTEHHFQCAVFTENMNSAFLRNVLFKLDSTFDCGNIHVVMNILLLCMLDVHIHQ